MRKKDIPNNNSLNATTLFAVAAKNFQRSKIDNEQLQLLTKFINITIDKISKQPALLLNDHLKTITEIILLLHYNLKQQFNRHTCTFGPLLKFFIATMKLTQKAFQYHQSPHQLMNIFWLCFEQKVEQPKIQDLNTKIEALQFLLEQKDESLDDRSSDKMIKQLFAKSSLKTNKKDCLLSNCILVILKISQPGLKQQTGKFLLSCIQNNQLVWFKKGLQIYQHMGSTQQVNNNFKLILAKLVQSQTSFTFYISMHQVVNFTHLLKADELLVFIFRMLQKIIEKPPNSQSINIVEIIKPLSQTDFCHISLDLKCDHIIPKIIEWATTNHHEAQEQQKEKMIEEVQQKQQKLIQFVKKLSNHRINEEGQCNTSELSRLYKNISHILINLISNPQIKRKMIISSIDAVSFKNDRLTQQQKQLVLDVIPLVLSQLCLNPKQKKPIKYAILLKKAEIEAQSVQQDILKEWLEQAVAEVNSKESLNYHYALIHILLKYEDKKQYVRKQLVKQILKDLQNTQKNKSNKLLVVNLSLFLQTLDAQMRNFPVKCRIKPMLRNIDILQSNLDVNNFLILAHRQSIFPSSPVLSQECQAMMAKLNAQIENYSKQDLTIFYSLIIELNNLFNNKDILPPVIQQINKLKKLSRLSELITMTTALTRQLNSKDMDIYAILLLLLKINNFNKLQSNPILRNHIGEFIINSNQNHSLSELLQLSNWQIRKASNLQSKYNQYLKEHQLVKMYSEAQQQGTVVKLLTTRQALLIHQKLSIDDKYQNNQMGDLFVLLCDQGKKIRNEREQQILRTYVLMMLLCHEGEHCKSVINKLKNSLQIVHQFALNQNQPSLAFLEKRPLNFIAFATQIIYEQIQNPIKSQKFQFITSLLQEDAHNGKKSLHKIIAKELSLKIGQNMVKLIVKRVNQGISFQKQQRQLLADQSKLIYQLLEVLIYEKQKDLQIIMEQLIQMDQYSDCEKSAYILKEILSIFAVVEDKSTSICDLVFNYILTLVEIFPGESKLQISNFICNFFKLDLLDRHQSLFSLIDKSTLTCSNHPNFRCLKCDEKKTFCSACFIQCHQGHPTCYLTLPPEVKSARCQCRQMQNSSCKFKKDEEGNQMPSKVVRQGLSPIFNPAPELIEKIKANQRRALRGTNLFAEDDRGELNSLIQEEYIERQLRGLANFGGLGQGRLDSMYNAYRNVQKDEQFPRLRYQRFYEREPDVFGNNSYKLQIDQKIQMKPPQVGQSNSNQEIQTQFIEEIYQLSAQMEIQQIVKEDLLIKRDILLPKFMTLMSNFCEKRNANNKLLTNLENWKFNFSNPSLQKIFTFQTKILNNGSFLTEIRKQNPINGISCVLIKKCIAQNNKFVLISSGSDITIFPKERILAHLIESKNIHHPNKNSANFQIHSLEFSPIDKNILCASGLHNLMLFTLSPDAHLSKTNHRYGVNNLYINKIKLSKLGIFLGVQKQIRLLNYQCKLVLTLKAQEANTLIREWSIFEKAAGCQVYFACPNGNIFYTDVSPNDEGKKEFTGRVIDQRKNRGGTGASTFVKELPEIGKFLIASFKDGYNIFGRLEGDQLQDMIDIRLKGIKTDKNILDNNFILGHIDIVKQNDEVYVIGTAKKYFPPEMSFNQGYLIAVKLKKDGSSEVQILNEDSTCEYFQLIHFSNKYFCILSLHTDGSLQLTTHSKITKNILDEEIKKIKQQEAPNNAFTDNKMLIEQQFKIRKSIQQQLSLPVLLKYHQRSSCQSFRQSAEPLKSIQDYTITKINDQLFEINQINFSKIITGISLPQYGTIDLPFISNHLTMEVAFTPLESLYLYALGTFRFTYIKQQDPRYNRESLKYSNPRLLQQLQRLDNKMSEFPDKYTGLSGSHMMASMINLKEQYSGDIVVVGKVFQTFRLKINKFDQIFQINIDEQAQSLEKTALIVRMLLSQCQLNQNICDISEKRRLIDSIKRVLPTAPKRLYLLLKQIVILAVKMIETQEGKKYLVTDQGHGLRTATQGRLLNYYNLLKADISEDELSGLLQLLVQVGKQDPDLMGYYMAKYSAIILNIQRRAKRIDNEERAIYLIQLYCMAYPILKYCQVSCTWMLASICNLVYTNIGFISVREALYQALVRSLNVNLYAWMKNICSNEPIDDSNVIQAEPIKKEDAPKDQISEIYNMFSRGEIDDEVLIKMLEQATKLEYLKQQEFKQDVPQQPQAEVILPEAQNQMIAEEENFSQLYSLLTDMLEECLDKPSDSINGSLSRIVVLYVIGKTIEHSNSHFDEFLRKIKRYVIELDLKLEGDNKMTAIGYCCVLREILSKSQYLKSKGYKQYPAYKEIEEQVDRKLTKINMESVQKRQKPPSLLGKIFKGQKPVTSAHIAYALALLLLMPCKPSHALLSLECYWLLPESRETYSKLKDITSIKQGVESGNIQKIYDIAKSNPKIWQQSQHISFIESWIESQKPGWELALELLAIYYEA